MENEIDIISLIKSRRYMNAALRELLSSERIAELKSQSYFVLVDLDTTDSDIERDQVQITEAKQKCEKIIMQEHKVSEQT